jgi:hypothetical protein
MPYVGVTFLRGDARSLLDRVIMRSTAGPYVHTELFLQRGDDFRYYCAVNVTPSGGLQPSGRTCGPPDPAFWDVVRFPISPAAYASTYALILQLLSMQLPYNARDLWQCCVPALLPYERDLDCQRLETWRASGVFCSQLCLLVLRRLVLAGTVALPPRAAAGVLGTNSRGCSPNALRRLLLPPAG